MEDDIDDFEEGYWLFVVDNMITISLILTTISIGSDFMKETYGFKDPSESSRFVTMPHLVASFAFVPLGYFADRYGYRQQIIIFSGLCLTLCFTSWVLCSGSTKHLASKGPWYLLGLPLATFYVL